MKKISLILILLLFCVSCASPKVVNVIGPNDSNLNCKENTKKEITTVLNRRIVLPFYIPIISLLCCFLLVKPSTQNNYFLN